MNRKNIKQLLMLNEMSLVKCKTFSVTLALEYF